MQCQKKVIENNESVIKSLNYIINESKSEIEKLRVKQNEFEAQSKLLREVELKSQQLELKLLHQQKESENQVELAKLDTK